MMNKIKSIIITLKTFLVHVPSFSSQIADKLKLMSLMFDGSFN